MTDARGDEQLVQALGITASRVTPSRLVTAEEPGCIGLFAPIPAAGQLLDVELTEEDEIAVQRRRRTA